MKSPTNPGRFNQTQHGSIDRAALVDCYLKKVIGWPIADHMRAKPVEGALINAAETTVIEANDFDLGSWQRLHCSSLP